MQIFFVKYQKLSSVKVQMKRGLSQRALREIYCLEPQQLWPVSIKWAELSQHEYYKQSSARSSFEFDHFWLIVARNHVRPISPFGRLTDLSPVPLFQIFFLMVVFGLFHGLIFLPVLLSLLGPDPYHGVSQLEDPEDNLAISPELLTEKHLAGGRETNLWSRF